MIRRDHPHFTNRDRARVLAACLLTALGALVWSALTTPNHAAQSNTRAVQVARCRLAEKVAQVREDGC
jgi:hypothetical protein